jgi:kynurenine formamidase
MMRTRAVVMAASVLCLIGFASGGSLDRSKLVDLTYELDETTIAWPTNRPFQRDQTAWGITAHGYWYASADFSMSEHAGTHIDAPIHFAQDQPSVDRIRVDHLVAPLVVVDVSEAAARDADYRLRVEDLQGWEARHGPIPAGAIVVMRSGWGRHWPDRVAYLGSTTPGDVTTLHFPGFSREAAEFLVRERVIVGIGIDTASIDYGPSRDFTVHRIVSAAGLYALENVAHADHLPEAGALLIALPLKIKGGTGGPVRLVAVLP